MNYRISHLLILMGVLFVLGFGCKDEPVDPDTDDPPATGIVRGFALSPDGFPGDFSRVDAFMDEIATFDRASVMFNGLWRDDPEGKGTSGAIPSGARLVAEQASGHVYLPIAVFGWRSGGRLFIGTENNPTNDWTNSDAANAFSEMAARYAESYTPQYILLGNETDFYFEQDPADYRRWIAVYRQTYNAIKDASPDTKVGTVFNFEHLTGQGSLVGWSTDQTQALTLHDQAILDVIGLTVYPFFDNRTPSGVSSDYLNPILDLLSNTPVLITETGWPAASPGGEVPWQPGQNEQVMFVEQLGAITGNRTIPLVQWLFLHPIEEGVSADILKTFGTISVRNSQGDKRPVYDVWKRFGDR